jgi:hypothetical protein
MSEYEFRMCRYCGQRIVRGFDRSAATAPSGCYCSPGCAEIANPSRGAANVEAETNTRRRIAASVDARLPAIIMWLADGETQEQVAHRLGVTQQAVAKLLKRLRRTACNISV